MSLDVNTDSLTAISYTKAQKPLWGLRNLVRKEKGYMDMMHIVVLELYQRDNNKLADTLTGLVATMANMEIEASQVLFMFSDIICNDVSGKLYKRE